MSHLDFEFARMPQIVGIEQGNVFTTRRENPGVARNRDALVDGADKSHRR
jgi:hypothetical protein